MWHWETYGWLLVIFDTRHQRVSPIYFIYLFIIIKIVHEVQQEKLEYTKETEQYTALGYQSLSTNAVNSSGNLISIKQVI